MIAKECKGCGNSCTLNGRFKLIIQFGKENPIHKFDFCSVDCLKEYIKGMV